MTCIYIEILGFCVSTWTRYLKKKFFAVKSSLFSNISTFGEFLDKLHHSVQLLKSIRVNSESQNWRTFSDVDSRLRSKAIFSLTNVPAGLIDSTIKDIDYYYLLHMPLLEMKSVNNQINNRLTCSKEWHHKTKAPFRVLPIYKPINRLCKRLIIHFVK